MHHNTRLGTTWHGTVSQERPKEVTLAEMGVCICLPCLSGCVLLAIVVRFVNEPHTFLKTYLSFVSFIRSLNQWNDILFDWKTVSGAKQNATSFNLLVQEKTSAVARSANLTLRCI